MGDRKIEMTRDALINGEARLFASSYARCLNPDCDDFGGIADAESPDVCCDGPWAIYVANTIEDATGAVLARSPDAEAPAGLEPARSITSAVDSRAVSAGERARRPTRTRSK